MSKQLDYSSLAQPIHQADIDEFKKTETQSAGKGMPSLSVMRSIAGTFSIVSVATILIILGMFILMGTRGMSISFITPIIIILIIGGIILFASQARTKQLTRLYRFAHVNGLQFLHDNVNPTYAGMIFDEGHSRHISEAYVFPDGREIGNYTYVTGSGKNRQLHNWGYVRLKLTRRLPNMVLDARDNNFFGKFTNLPDSFSKGQTLTLEGDFNNHFTLYAPKEYERDALYVFTPDVMAAVVDSGKSYDMEVVDDNLMLYGNKKFDLTSRSELEGLLKIADAIGSELLDQSKNYADERVGSPTQNIVAAPGRRLKTSFSIFTTVIVAAVVLYQILNIAFSFMTK